MKRAIKLVAPSTTQERKDDKTRKGCNVNKRQKTQNATKQHIKDEETHEQRNETHKTKYMKCDENPQSTYH